MRKLLPVLYVLMLAAAVFLQAQVPSPKQENSPKIAVASELISGVPIYPSWMAQQIAISSAGDQIVYYGRSGNQPAQLFLRDMKEREEVPIAGSASGNKPSPAFSPHGKYVAFFANGKLNKIPIAGGKAEELCNAPNPFGLTWGPNGYIYFNNGPGEGIWRIQESGGKSERFTTPDYPSGESGHHMPTSFLPDGKHLLFSIWYDTSRYNLAILDIETGKHSVLLKDTAYGVYSPSGHLVFSRWDGVYGVAFDAAAQKVLGPEVLLIRDAWLGELSNLGQFALSANGTLVYRTGKPADRELVLVDMENKAQLLPLPPRRYIWPRFSPDGKRILVNIQGGPYVSFGVFDIEDKDLRMITIKGNTRFPLWAPDGKSIVFSSDLAGPGQWKTYTKVIDNTKPPQLIFDPQKTGSRIRPETFTPDGKTILGEGTLKSVRDTQTGTAIVAMKLDGPGQLTEFIPAQRSVGIYNVRLSQDGRFLAYVSTRSGRNEIWISPYANPAQATMVSKEGGQRNVWSRDGKKIYFVAGTRMMVADVTTDPQLQVTAPRVLFENIPYAFGDYYTQPNWDITPDGKYFIMIRAAQADAPGKPDPSANRLKLITNFFAELSQKARKR